MIKNINENVSVNQVDDDLHIEIPLKDLKNFNGNVMVDLPGAKKQINARDYRYNPDDYDIISEFEDDEYDSMDSANNSFDSNNTQPTLPEQNTNVDAYIKAYLTAELALSDVEHIRLHATGESFDNIAQCTLDYKYRLFNDVETLSRLAMETHDSVPNKALAVTIIKDYALQSDTTYNYEKANNKLKQIICNYVVALRDLHDAVDTSDTKNMINTLIREWTQQVNYFTSRRLG